MKDASKNSKRWFATNQIRRCFLIKIPNRIFFFILSPANFIFSKFYASILRISVDMGVLNLHIKFMVKRKQNFL